MKTSTAGIAFICSHEGFVPHVYKDVAGIPTIGFGHALLPGESFPAPISRDQAMDLMGRDLAKFEAAVNTLVTVPLSQCEFDALVSFSYNCGTGALKASSTLRLLNQGDYTAAADGLLLWNKRTDQQSGKLVVDQGLAARRMAERDLFLSDGNAAASDNPYDGAGDGTYVGPV